MPIPDPRVATLDQSLWNFVENTKEAIGFLEALDDPTTFLRVSQDAVALEGAQYEAIRLLHNCLAAAHSLVCHARRMVVGGALVSESVLAQHQERVAKQFAGDPLHQFVQNLRNYMLHYDLPLTAATFSATRKGSGAAWDCQAGLWLDLKSLQAWEEWNSKAREYMRAAGQSANLLDLLKTYTDKVVDLHKWLFQRDQEDVLARLRLRLVGEGGTAES